MLVHRYVQYASFTITCIKMYVSSVNLDSWHDRMTFSYLDFLKNNYRVAFLSRSLTPPLYRPIFLWLSHGNEWAAYFSSSALVCSSVHTLAIMAIPVRYCANVMHSFSRRVSTGCKSANSTEKSSLKPRSHRNITQRNTGQRASSHGTKSSVNTAVTSAAVPRGAVRRLALRS